MDSKNPLNRTKNNNNKSDGNSNKWKLVIGIVLVVIFITIIYSIIAFFMAWWPFNEVKKKYNCDKDTFQCVNPKNNKGEYDSLSKCDEECKPITKYECNQNKNMCIESTEDTGNRQYESYEECENNCNNCGKGGTDTYKCVDGRCVDSELKCHIDPNGDYGIPCDSDFYCEWTINPVTQKCFQTFKNKGIYGVSKEDMIEDNKTMELHNDPHNFSMSDVSTNRIPTASLQFFDTVDECVNNVKKVKYQRFQCRRDIPNGDECKDGDCINYGPNRTYDGPHIKINPNEINKCYQEMSNMNVWSNKNIKYNTGVIPGQEWTQEQPQECKGIKQKEGKAIDQIDNYYTEMVKRTSYGCGFMDLQNCYDVCTPFIRPRKKYNEASVLINVNQEKIFGSSVIGHRSDYPLDIIEEKTDDVVGVLSFSECARNCLSKDINNYNYYIHSIPSDQKYPEDKRILMCNNTNESIYTYSYDNMGENVLNPNIRDNQIIHNDLGTEYITVDRGLCDDKKSQTMDDKIHQTYPDAFNSLIDENSKDDTVEVQFKKLKKLYSNDGDDCKELPYENVLELLKNESININPNYYNNNNKNFYLNLSENNIFENRNCEPEIDNNNNV